MNFPTNTLSAVRVAATRGEVEVGNPMQLCIALLNGAVINPKYMFEFAQVTFGQLG